MARGKAKSEDIVTRKHGLSNMLACVHFKDAFRRVVDDTNFWVYHLMLFADYYFTTVINNTEARDALLAAGQNVPAAQHPTIDDLNGDPNQTLFNRMAQALGKRNKNPGAAIPADDPHYMGKVAAQYQTDVLMGIIMPDRSLSVGRALTLECATMATNTINAMLDRHESQRTAYLEAKYAGNMSHSAAAMTAKRLAMNKELLLEDMKESHVKKFNRQIAAAHEKLRDAEEAMTVAGKLLAEEITVEIKRLTAKRAGSHNWTEADVIASFNSDHKYSQDPSPVAGRTWQQVWEAERALLPDENSFISRLQETA